MDPSALTVGQVLSDLRDISLILGMLALVWKARGAFDAVCNFTKRITEHMDSMDLFAKDMKQALSSIVNNHLRHIEYDMKTVAGRVHEIPPGPVEPQDPFQV